MFGIMIQTHNVIITFDSFIDVPQGLEIYDRRCLSISGAAPLSKIADTRSNVVRKDRVASAEKALVREQRRRKIVVGQFEILSQHLSVL